MPHPPRYHTIFDDCSVQRYFRRLWTGRDHPPSEAKTTRPCVRRRLLYTDYSVGRWAGTLLRCRFSVYTPACTPPPPAEFRIPTCGGGVLYFHSIHCCFDCRFSLVWQLNTAWLFCCADCSVKFCPPHAWTRYCAVVLYEQIRL